MHKLQKEIMGMKGHKRDAGDDDKTRRRNWGLHCNENPTYVFLFWE
jgi:hypothetical protein